VSAATSCSVQERHWWRYGQTPQPDRHHPRIARFAVVGGDRRGAVEGLTIGGGAGWALEDNVAAWHPAHMEPPIVGLGHPATQRIVVGIDPVDQDLLPTRQCVREQADLLEVSF
jgi:hypothetical protein